MLAVLTMGAALVLGMPAAPAVSCPPPAGWEAVVVRQPRYVIFGELHGTEQSPRWVGDTVCHLAQQGERILLAMELHASHDAAFQRTWRGPHAGFEAALTGTMIDWTMKGVASRAWLAMLVRLHALKDAGAPIDVVAFTGGRDQAQWESVANMPGQNGMEAMQAANIRRAAEAGRYDRVVVLVGSIHAGRVPITLGGVKVEPMAMRLGTGVLALAMAYSSGSAWNCVARPGTERATSSGTADLDCGAQDAGAWPLSGKPRIMVDDAVPADIRATTARSDMTTDGLFFVGAITASSPVAP